MIVGEGRQEEELNWWQKKNAKKKGFVGGGVGLQKEKKNGREKMEHLDIEKNK